ncbi:MAG: hypothetical protein KatS3mg115_1958 [Candidatus Poribacteria bacterium]|nr:MAG: hypothetical protein KatS3mg115_1958 [Candidatus Poribacteria bacterium]
MNASRLDLLCVLLVKQDQQLIGLCPRQSSELPREEEMPLLEVETPFGFRIRGPLWNYNMSRLFLSGHHDAPYEPATCFLVLLMAYFGGTFLDIGAHLGYFSLLAARNSSEPLTVHAFEPATFYYRLLGENVRLNGLIGTIHVHRVALSDHSGEAPLYLEGGMTSLDATWAPQRLQKESPAGEERVPLARLDDLFSPAALTGPITAKIDVEGHELAVLRGGEELFSSPKCSL